MRQRRRRLLRLRSYGPSVSKPPPCDLSVSEKRAKSSSEQTHMCVWEPRFHRAELPSLGKAFPAQERPPERLVRRLQAKRREQRHGLARRVLTGAGRSGPPSRGPGG